MDREILFRGKRIDDEEWVEGDICRSAQQIYIHPNRNSFRVTKAGLSKLLVMHEINPATIGQYTGLTDKNGKRIFEGDILELTCTEYPQEKELFSVRYGPYEIVYEDECESDCVIGWYTKGIGRSESWGEHSLFADAEKANMYYEVIGNIHDNPELLEGD